MDTYCHGEKQLDKMILMGTSTPVCTRTKFTNTQFESDSVLQQKSKSARVNFTEHDSGYADSLADITCSSDHDKSHLSLFSNTPRTQERHSSVLDFISPITLSDIDSNTNTFTQRNSLQQSVIPEEEFRDGIKGMSMYSFDLGIENSKSEETISHCVSEGNELKFIKIMSTISPDESDRFRRFLDNYSPRERDRLIGRKIGLRHVDILGELPSRSIPVNLVLSYMKPSDLYSMCQVSRRWRNICEESPSIKRELQECSERKKDSFMGKENYVKRLTTTDRQNRGLTNPSVKLGFVQKVEPLRPATFDSSPTKNISFPEAVQLLQNGERLRHCPKCYSASIVKPIEDRGSCLKCQYDFCVKCLTEYHQARPCVPVVCQKAQTDNVGSKKSKRNLKRL